MLFSVHGTIAYRLCGKNSGYCIKRRLDRENPVWYCDYLLNHEQVNRFMGFYRGVRDDENVSEIQESV
jgi:hypothetical protein